MLLVHILFVLFSIDLSPPIRTSRVPSSTPGACILEVDEAGNPVDVAANDVNFTHLTVPEAEATFANASKTPSDMHRNVSSASAAPEGSVASQVSAILDPLQAAMVELRQKHESAETLLGASISEAEAQKQQNASIAMEAPYSAKNAGLQPRSGLRLPDPVGWVADYAAREALKDAPSATTMAAGAQTVGGLLSAEDALQFFARVGYLGSDVRTLSQGSAPRRDSPEDTRRATEQYNAVKRIERDFRITDKKAWGMLLDKGALTNIVEAERLVREQIDLERRQREQEREEASRVSGAWQRLVLRSCLEEFPQLANYKLPSDRNMLYLPWKIEKIFEGAPDHMPSYEYVSQEIRQQNANCRNNQHLPHNPTPKDVKSLLL